jgi:atypical dual specificity phosphatase
MTQWWIDKANILRSCNPSAAELEKLFQDGFRTIISLLNEKQQPANYDTKKIKAMGFKRYSIPMMDGTAPTPAGFRKSLEIIDKALPAGKVLVHCEGGSGRMGTMAAAYWMKKGLSARETIEKVRQANPTALETPGQVRSLFRLEANKDSIL